MPFVKGISGNPGGKPKELKSIQLAARAISPLALRELKRILNDPDAGKQAKIAAAIAVWDRAWGRPKQEVAQELSHSMSDSLLTALDQISQRDARLNELRDSGIAQATSRTVEELSVN